MAKDLTKMSSKSAVKLVAGGEGQLFRWVALLTGSKNALKGVGFFHGRRLVVMAGVRARAMDHGRHVGGGSGAGAHGDDRRPRAGQEKPKPGDLFSKSREINFPSAARIFLFAARDVWFVVGVPVYLYDQAGWSFNAVAGFMALWVIGYGAVQAGVPKILPGLGRSLGGRPRRPPMGRRSVGSAGGLGGAVGAWRPRSDPRPGGGRDGLALGRRSVGVWGGVFAVNSAVHSYLIVAYSDSDKVALNVGFYYMANAAGRLMGTLSGLLFQIGGLGLTLWSSAALVLLATILTVPLARPPAPRPAKAG